MDLILICVGKTEQKEINSLIKIYKNRLVHYCNFSIIEIPKIKNKNISKNEQKIKESRLIQKNLKKNDFIILLDENGKKYSSKKFSIFLNKILMSGSKRIVFILGGPYGFSKDILLKYINLMSMSDMTFSHQMIRLFFIEQLYRGFTILKNHPYHN